MYPLSLYVKFVRGERCFCHISQVLLPLLNNAVKMAKKEQKGG